MSTTSEFLTIYDAKLMEYMLSVTYLILFLGFWNYVQTPAPKKVPKPARQFHVNFHYLHDFIFGHSNGHSEARS